MRLDKSSWRQEDVTFFFQLGVIRIVLVCFRQPGRTDDHVDTNVYDGGLSMLLKMTFRCREIH